MSAELELRLGRIASLAHRARVALSKGCFSSSDECDGNCGGHQAVGWTLDPREVLAAVEGSPASVIDLVVDRDRLAHQVEILTAGLRAQVELDDHGDCPLCPGRRNGCSEVRDLLERVSAARKVADSIKEES